MKYYVLIYKAILRAQVPKHRRQVPAPLARLSPEQVSKTTLSKAFTTRSLVVCRAKDQLPHTLWEEEKILQSDFTLV